MLRHSGQRLILASASASRRALLAAAGLTFEVRPADVDEAVIKQEARAQGVDAEVAALRLADAKAAAVARDEPDALVIGADQILVCNGVWFDKPVDVAAAREQLRALRGRVHVLVTAVVCHHGAGRVWHDVASPRLTMRDFSDHFLNCYLALEGDAVIETVGTYRLEGRGIQLFDAVEGEYWAVLGLPMLKLLGFIRSVRHIAF
jgi:nucleoside triphosphate pyrophosphatase